MRIYLVGFMGVGKTTVGRALAERLGFPFVDLDEVIEREVGMSVREIFDLHGEPFFRNREHTVLRQCSTIPDAVIATGGGTFVFEENRALIRDSGVSIHLSASFDLVASRVRTHPSERPLFRDERNAFRLFGERQRHYRLADVSIDASVGETPRELVERIVLVLRQTGRADRALP